MPSVVTASLVEAFFEVFLYGGCTVLFVTVIYLFRSRRGISFDKMPAIWVLLGLIIQFLAVTTHWIVTIYQTFYAILSLEGGVQAEVFYNNQSTPTSVAQITLVAITSLITNVLVIHRLYVIYSRSLKVIICPIGFLLGQTVCESAIVYLFANSFSGPTRYSLSNGWVTGGIALSILVCAYSSGMIWWRIRNVNKGLNQFSERIHGGTQLMSILAVIVESAALQTLWAIAILVTFQFGLVGQIVFTGSGPAILGISTLLIHARIGLGWAHNPDQDINSTPTRINLPANHATAMSSLK
ncbi:hypothetical protein C8R43DRAFT_1114109 [Mycena crocata]|nr:hypothetical protein C8R43DRAFT_1114109 [Mycena crocata]